MDSAQADEAKAWIQATVSAEAKRIASNGARAIPLTVKNCGILIESPSSSSSSGTALSTVSAGGRVPKPNDVTNRLEVDTGMDFGKVTQVMVSPSQEYPFAHRLSGGRLTKGRYNYAHLLCFTAASQTTCLLLPYIWAPHLRRRDITTGAGTTGGGKTSRAGNDDDEADDDEDEEYIPADKSERGAFANNLNNWLFINNHHQHHRFRVHEYHTV